MSDVQCLPHNIVNRRLVTVREGFDVIVRDIDSGEAWSADVIDVKEDPRGCWRKISEGKSVHAEVVEAD